VAVVQSCLTALLANEEAARQRVENLLDQSADLREYRP
jgi:hypothetical protein